MFNDFVESLRATPTPTWIVEQPAVSQLSRANAVPCLTVAMTVHIVQMDEQ